eukprot:TRINITY_DN8518_c0_g1_i1.p1 TRINITY_DN8518_c0_g1~~TRINITY_DN8518_c0_g1_i1.p1  ORF type:complete len:355 (+),score=62.26 TRINITY_DN8518_c0_g1_i1:106-1170(+)
MARITEEKGVDLGRLWGMNHGRMKLLRQSENDTWEVRDLEDRYVLRLTPHFHRTKDSIQAELDFIESLGHSNIFQVCRPISSPNGKLIHEVYPYDDINLYYAVLFEYAQGEYGRTNWNGILNDNLVAAIGRTMAEMHNITAQRGTNLFSESQWDQIESNIPTANQTHSGATDILKIQLRADQGDPDSQALASFYLSKVHPFLERCGKPTHETFGIIHGDINCSNFFSLHDTLYLFDFDEVQKNWFGTDIAVVLRASHYFEETKIVDGFDGPKFRKIFLESYKEATKIMKNSGHLEEDMLEGFYLYREFYYAALAVDILHQARSKVKDFEPFITSYCEEKVQRFHRKFVVLAANS